ncbi:D-alanyl-lipoteichoic acid acyltransferase DltB, MBOAT superfamily [Anaerocolumna jejuensis DSM 15929]|uniref:D-alanyl-lipoteichoic acid acyltransferase DltB, MBOAT superfamily n=1 Tax=Anaerocolumna jejuensis DSM 15929 TaxID=1121322 RepID=A0A1M7DHX6_9FIRM|nr:MBOAT family O-acyltransferase [Anaerocolumna jejuensis]SHL79082.1 D-alanyl-lipoteichoic acid acyltransferase DltB, MBOAT superfamily [Anaerocolumna jejuensis DSM 15929]
MTYNSLLYLLVFLPAVLLFYQLVPARHRPKVLLIASYIFFCSISGKLLVYLLLSTLSIHYIGLWLSYSRKDYLVKEQAADDKKALKAVYARKNRGILWFGIGMQLGMLLVLKYADFFGGNINELLKLLSSPVLLPEFKFALPIGISFYTLQAISYLVDVYYQKIEADDNLGRLALYMAFFPGLMEGPICRYSQTAEALDAGKPLEYKNITFGTQRILWGLFKKLIIADRLNMLVVTVFDKPNHYGGVTVIAAAILYTFQLYADFSGCIDMTIGTAEMFGVTIPENFKQPFFSKSASEFWRRWHITLGAWLKDYIFYPISLTKFVKNLGKSSRAKFGKHMGQIIPSSIALFGVWLCNGLWHGTGWNYIFFGLYYFTLIMLGNLFEPLIQKLTDFLRINRNSAYYHVFQTVKTLPIIFIGELFFRANDLASGMKMFGSIFTGFRIADAANGTLLNLGLSLKDFAVVFAGFVLVLIVGILHERGISIREKIAGWNIVARWGFLYAAILLVIIFGAYGSGYIPAKLIYAGF